ncbi:MAG: leucine-rich repeat domain-containing protein [Aureispira sp.]|nr:leucine-rich repeat domain-containing protein [Aureispira sp.]
MRDVKTTCVRKLGSKKEIVEVTTFYYNINYTAPAAIIKISDAQGHLLYAEKTANVSASSTKFGYQKCEYFRSDKMKADYAKGETSFKVKLNQTSQNDAFQKASTFVNNAIFFNYAEEEFKVASAKGKNFDYSELDEAQAMAVDAYKKMKKNWTDQTAAVELQKAIGIWEKTLEESNIEDKKARINQKITMALHENIAIASMFLTDYEKAKIAINNSVALIPAGLTTDRTEVRKALKILIFDRARAYDWNKDLPVVTKRHKLSVARHPSSAFAQGKKDLAAFRIEKNVASLQEDKEIRDNDIAAGKANPYTHKIIYSVATGYMLTLPSATGEASIEAMLAANKERLNAFPVEVTGLVQLNQLILKNNNIKDIPKDITKLNNLKRLDLSNNQLTTLPTELGQLSNLKKLIIKGNKIPKAIIDQIQDQLPKCKIIL